MKNKNWQLKQKATVVRGEQSRVTSPELDKLSLSELERVAGGFFAGVCGGVSEEE